MYRCLPLSPLKPFLSAVQFPETSVWFLLHFLIPCLPFQGVPCNAIFAYLSHAQYPQTSNNAHLHPEICQRNSNHLDIILIFKHFIVSFLMEKKTAIVCFCAIERGISIHIYSVNDRTRLNQHNHCFNYVAEVVITLKTPPLGIWRDGAAGECQAHKFEYQSSDLLKLSLFTAPLNSLKVV